MIGASGKSLKKRYDLSAPQGVRGRNADLTLMQKALSFKPKVSLKQGIGETYRWIKEQIEKESIPLSSRKA